MPFLYHSKAFSGAVLDTIEKFIAVGHEISTLYAIVAEIAIPNALLLDLFR